MQKKSEYEILSRKMNKDDDFRRQVLEYTFFLQEDTKNIIRLWHFLNRVDHIPRCDVCDKEKSFSKRGTRDTHGYNKFCNLSCRSTFNNNKRTSDQLEDIRQKISHTSLQKFGKAHFFQAEIVREKITNTFQAKYGVSNPSQIEDVKKKKEVSCISRLGFANPSQSPDVQAKKTKSSKKKIFTSSAGKKYELEGYEPHAIERLLKLGIDDDDILTGKQIIERIGSVAFLCGEKKHFYHPDIFIISQQKIVEVKSEYWYHRQLDLNKMKRDAILNLGLKFEFWVYDTFLKLRILN